MKVVIQCAGRKRDSAGRLIDETGAEVNFVACPDLYAHELPGSRSCRPDDLLTTDAGTTWRNVLAQYNERYQREGSNPDRLLPAGELYSPRVYRRLIESFGPNNVYILSAGWGLVRADFLLPDYDITFSNQPNVPQYARRGRRMAEAWRDFNQLSDAQLSPDEPIHFFGGQDYLPLFYRLADGLPGIKVIHHKAKPLCREGYDYDAYKGAANTNWHYPAAEAFISSRSVETV